MGFVLLLNDTAKSGRQNRRPDPLEMDNREDNPDGSDDETIVGLTECGPRSAGSRLRSFLGSALFFAITDGFCIWIAYRAIQGIQHGAIRGKWRIIHGDGAISVAWFQLGIAIVLAAKFGYSAGRFPKLKWMLYPMGVCIGGYGLWRMAQHFTTLFK
jgi:hypothetical protein